MEQLLENIQIIYNRKRKIEELSGGDFREKLREKKKEIFNKHNEWINEMKQYKHLSSIMTLYDIVVCSYNLEMGYGASYNTLYEKWSVFAKTDDLTKNSNLDKSKHNNILSLMMRGINNEKSPKRDDGNNYFEPINMIDIMNVSIYKPVGYSSKPTYFFPEIQDHFKSDDYYITKSAQDDYLVAHIPSIIKFMEINSEINFINKKIKAYDIIEFIELLATSESVGPPDINVFFALFSDILDISSKEEIQNSGIKLTDGVEEVSKNYKPGDVRDTIVKELNEKDGYFIPEVFYIAKVLAFDHGRVLDGEMIEPNKFDNSNDFNLGTAWGHIRSLRNGKQIANYLNELTNYGYLIAYHSTNVYDDQIELHVKLMDECNRFGITWPKISCMPAKTTNTTDTNITNRDDLNIKNIVYLSEQGDGKTNVRKILKNTLKIGDESKCVIFDDGNHVIDKAYEEGYDVAFISDDPPQTTKGIKSTTIIKKLEELIEKEKNN